jgi:hypothetical protein
MTTGKGFDNTAARKGRGDHEGRNALAVALFSPAKGRVVADELHHVPVGHIWRAGPKGEHGLG